MDKCKFGLAWHGPCGKPSHGDMCAEHFELVCKSCGADATHECDVTMGLVCGALLCDDCEHMADERGVASDLRHCRKGEQKYKWWYERGEDM